MRLIDISHTLNGNTPVYPGDYDTSLAPHRLFEKDGYNTYLLKSCLHTGTHVDLPMHLTADTKAADDYPLDAFMGKGTLLDVRGEDIIGMRPEYGESVAEGGVVLLYTGFDGNYYSEGYFTAHPPVSGELAEFFINKRIKMLGMDMPSPDRAPFPIHKALLKNGVIMLENLTNLKSLGNTNEFTVFAFPLKISAEASFVRAVCAVD